MRPGEVYWAASDIGWVVGHSYIVYAPLLHGCTTRALRGQAGRHARCRRLLAGLRRPRRERAVHRADGDPGDQAGRPARRSSSRRPRPVARCARCSWPASGATRTRCAGPSGRWARPVIDHWWQTETGWPIAANCMGIEPLPVKAGLPDPGGARATTSACSTRQGDAGAAGRSAHICVRLPLPPGCSPTLWGSDERWVEAYLSQHPGYYLTGDAGYIDDDGYLFVMSRIDDVINTAGHRLSTGAMEEVLAEPSGRRRVRGGRRGRRASRARCRSGSPCSRRASTATRTRSPASSSPPSATDRARRLVQAGARRARAAQDPLGQGAARHDPQDRRRRGVEDARHHRGPGRARRLPGAARAAAACKKTGSDPVVTRLRPRPSSRGAPPRRRGGR